MPHPGIMENVFRHILARAAQRLGSRSALAELLRVPYPTLERWMDGRSPMPLRAFYALLDLLARDDPSASPAAEQSATGTQALRFNIGGEFASCERCASEVFHAMTSSTPVPLSAELACRDCGARIVHRMLLAKLAQRAIGQRVAPKAVRKREPYRSIAVDPASDVGLS